MSRAFVEVSYLICTALKSTVENSFGPFGRDKLIISETNKLLITNSSQSILSSLNVCHPVAKIILESIHAFTKINGDGGTGLLLMLHAAVQEVWGLVRKATEPEATYILCRLRRALWSLLADDFRPPICSNIPNIPNSSVNPENHSHVLCNNNHNNSLNSLISTDSDPMETDPGLADSYSGRCCRPHGSPNRIKKEGNKHSQIVLNRPLPGLTSALWPLARCVSTSPRDNNLPGPADHHPNTASGSNNSTNSECHGRSSGDWVAAARQLLLSTASGAYAPRVVLNGIESGDWALH
jgi:hypothetical protein